MKDSSEAKLGEPTEYCCTQFLSVRPKPDSSSQLEARNYLCKTGLYLETTTLQALCKCILPNCRSTLCQRFCHLLTLSEDQSQYLFEILLKANLLVDVKNSDEVSSQSERERWEKYNWLEAYYLHATTRNYPFLNYALPDFRAPDFALMESYRTESDPPPCFKDYADSRYVPLAVPALLDEEIELSCCISGTSTRGYCGLDDTALSTLLFEVFGTRGSFHWQGQGDFLMKSSPSGGARHPTECYVLLGNNSLLGTGVFHYSVKQHGLHRLKSIENDYEFVETLRKCFWDFEDRIKFEPYCVLVLTSVVERAQWRYRDPRSHRAILMDSGHLLGTCRIVLNSLNINYFVTHGMRERAMDDLLAIKPENELQIHSVFIQ